MQLERTWLCHSSCIRNNRANSRHTAQPVVIYRIEINIFIAKNKKMYKNKFDHRKNSNYLFNYNISIFFILFCKLNINIQSTELLKYRSEF